MGRTRVFSPSAMNKTPLLLFLVLVSVAFAKLIGGLSEERPATEEVQHIALKVRPDIESKLGLQSESTFEVVRYKTQIVAGVNYFMKINVEGQYIHARIYKDLHNNVQLVGLQTGKTLEDAIEYF